MDQALHEQTITCPHCWESNLLVLDPFNAGQVLIEDCQVCCNPINVTFELDDDVVVSVSAEI